LTTKNGKSITIQRDVSVSIKNMVHCTKISLDPENDPLHISLIEIVAVQHGKAKRPFHRARKAERFGGSD